MFNLLSSLNTLYKTKFEMIQTNSLANIVKFIKVQKNNEKIRKL